MKARLAVNSVTMGDYERPLVISRFVKGLSNAFQLLNLKNDLLRKRFDTIKYDVKKIEEGGSEIDLANYSGLRFIIEGIDYEEV